MSTFTKRFWAAIAVLGAIFAAIGLVGGPQPVSAGTYVDAGWSTYADNITGTIHPGDSVTMIPKAMATVASQNATVIVALYDPSDTLVNSQEFTNRSFVVNVRRGFTASPVTIPSALGVYHVRVSIASPTDDTAIIHVNTDGTHFTVAAATTTTAAATTTTAAATTTTTPASPACGLSSAAFCSTFDTAYAGTKTQTGDLDPLLWGVSRIGETNIGQSMFNTVPTSHNACDGGGSTLDDPTVGTGTHSWATFGTATPPPADARICNGRYVDSVNDGGGDTSIHAYPKQPFDFAGRTGKVVFDVSSDAAGTHAAWPEFVITDEPVPGIRRDPTSAQGVNNAIFAKNMIGFSLAGGGGQSSNNTGVDAIYQSINSVYSHPAFTTYGTVTKGCIAGHVPNCPTTKMNHFEVQISTSRIDIYGTDPGSSTLVHLAGADLSLGFSRGLIWINDVHYNAHKAIELSGNVSVGTQYDHSFAWDNVGFDGPKTYRDVGHDVPLANVTGSSSESQPAKTEGYAIGTGRSFTVSGVNQGTSAWTQTPTSAKVVANIGNENSSAATMSVTLNSCSAVSRVSDHTFGTDAFAWQFAASCAVTGTNTITFTPSSGASTMVANASLIMVAAQPVP